MIPIKPSTLSISPGRGRLGVAVSHPGRLVYYGVKSLRQFRSDAEIKNGLEKILVMLVTRYGISKLIIPDLNKQQRHSASVTLIDSYIEQFAVRYQLTIQRYDPLAVRRTLCDGAKPTKAATSEKLAELYPVLGRYCRGDSEWERRYYGYLFSSIAALRVFEFDKQISAKNGPPTNSPHQQHERIICT